METPVKGNKIIFLFRLHSEATSASGLMLALTTENSLSISKDADSTVTKDGTIRTPNEAEIEVSATTMLPVGDTMIGKLKGAMLNDELLDIWRVNLSEAGTGSNKFKGTYYQGYMTSFEESSPAEGSVECSMTWGINGKGADGDVTVTAEQQEAAEYVFTDAVKANG